jgi:molecular chaperone HscB
MVSNAVNHFALFGLPVQYNVDLEALDAAYRTVQTQVHPDRFASAGAAERRAAMQWATQANEAYQTLRHPLRRLVYLLHLQQVDVEAENNTAMPPAFLMQQMEWREALSDAQAERDFAAVDALSDEVRTMRDGMLSQACVAFDAADYDHAAGLARQLMFLDKFEADISQAYERLES